MSPDVKNVAVTEIAKDVPIFLSELSKTYNQSGNARIFFTLKSYALRAFGIAYRDGIHKMTKGKGMQKVEGAYNLVRLASVVAIVGGGVEELKDLLNGKVTPFWENASDEILNLFFLSRYSLAAADRQGPGAIVDGLFSIPAFGIANNLWKLKDGDLAIMKSIPFMKEIYSRGTEGGKTSIYKRNRENIFGSIKRDVVATGKISRETKKKIEKYNSMIKDLNKGKKPDEIKAKPITYTSQKNARRRYLDEQKRGKGGGLLKAVKDSAESILGIVGPNEAKAAGKPIADYLDMNKVIDKHSKRLGVEPEVARDNLNNFLQIVGIAENDGKLKGGNTKSSAKGLYQFIDSAIEPALNRLARTTGWKPWMKELKKTKDIESLSWERQSLLIMGDLFEKTAVVDGKKVPGMGDMYLRDILETGNLAAMKNAYMVLHHTKPDDSVLKNWDRAVDKYAEGKV